jgi:hypothetical protein
MSIWSSKDSMHYRDIMNKFFITLTLFVSQSLSAQYSSIFSQYGLGKIQSTSFGSNKGCGELAAGYNSPMNINYTNPASYTAAAFTIFDVGGFAENGTTQQGDSTYRSSNGTLSHLALLLPVKPNKLAISMGMMPYSSLKYNTSGTLQDATVGKIDFTHNINGAINQVYLGGAYKIKKWSVGVNLGYLFGNMVDTKTYYIEDSVGLDTRKIESVTMKAFNYNIGVQYNSKVNKNDFITIGAYGSSRTNANFSKYSSNKSFFSYNGSFKELSQTDTSSIDYSLPLTFGLGCSYTKNNYITYGIDFRQTNWNDFDYNNGPAALNNAWKLGIGIEYKPIAKAGIKDKKYLNKIIYRAGASLGKSESAISTGAVNEYAFNTNVSLPMMNAKLVTYFNLGLDLGARGFDSKTISERYWRVNLSFTITDKWFNKVRFD